VTFIFDNPPPYPVQGCPRGRCGVDRAPLDLPIKTGARRVGKRFAASQRPRKRITLRHGCAPTGLKALAESPVPASAGFRTNA
jgi:hypothetical protein